MNTESVSEVKVNAVSNLIRGYLDTHEGCDQPALVSLAMSAGLWNDVYYSESEFYHITCTNAESGRNAKERRSAVKRVWETAALIASTSTLLNQSIEYIKVGDGQIQPLTAEDFRDCILVDISKPEYVRTIIEHRDMLPLELAQLIEAVVGGGSE